MMGYYVVERWNPTTEKWYEISSYIRLSTANKLASDLWEIRDRKSHYRVIDRDSRIIQKSFRAE